MNAITDPSKKQVQEAFKATQYRTENSYSVLKVYFHEGDGWNYRVSYHFRINKTRIVRYYTNGHENRVENNLRTFTGLHIIKDHQDAANMYHNGLSEVLGVDSVSLLKRAVEALDDYLNAGSKDTRANAADKAKQIYQEYYGKEYRNRNER